MAITLHYHPFSRAAGVVWTLEELGQPYDLKFIDIRKNEQKSPEEIALNPMGKIPVLVDGDVVVTEAAAIALYLGDRYAAGRLAPALDDPRRGTYFRWSLFAPSVIEPGSLAKMQKWEYRASQAGWGDHDAMLQTIESAVAGRQWLLGDMFSMADVIFGGTLSWMVRFGMLQASPAVGAYVGRINARPAAQRAAARNAAMIKEHGLQT
jgi:glutathione S-transferase